MRIEGCFIVSQTKPPADPGEPVWTQIRPDPVLEARQPPREGRHMDVRGRSVFQEVTWLPCSGTLFGCCSFIYNHSIFAAVFSVKISGIESVWVVGASSPLDVHAGPLARARHCRGFSRNINTSFPLFFPRSSETARERHPAATQRPRHSRGPPEPSD